MIKTWLKTIAALAGGYLCLESYYFRGIYAGYLNGSLLCDVTYRTKDGGPIFYMLQGDPYYKLPNVYFCISLFLILFVAGQLIRREILSQGISLLAISISVLGFIYIYNFKSTYVLDEDKYMDLMRITLPMDLTHIWLAVAILIYQIISILYYWLYERPKNSTTINGFS